MYPIWCGLFQVTAKPNNVFLNGKAGAYVWAAAQAEDAAKLILRVQNSILELGLTLVGSEELAQVEDPDDLSDSVAALIPQARKDVNSVVFGTWHMFEHQEA